MSDLRRGKEDWDPEEKRTIAGAKSASRDSAFRLLYALLQEGAEDRNRAYNATLFVISHPRIFSAKTRTMIRKAFDGEFSFSFNQRRELDKWPVRQGLQEDDATTDEDPYDYDYWDSDDS